VSRRAEGLWLATATALSWAVLAIALKYSLKLFSSGTIVWVRMSLAFAILVALFAWRRRGQLSILRGPPWQGLVAGIFISINYFAYMKGVELTTASNAQIMIQLAPLSFALACIFFLGEYPTRKQWLGLTIAITGFGFFYWDQLLVSWDTLDRFQTGNLWLLLAAATWTIFALIQRGLLKTWPPQQFNMLIYGISTLLLFPLADAADLVAPTWLGGMLLLFLALNTVIAYGAFSEALLRIPSSQVSLIISVNPLLTIAIMTYLTHLNVEWISGEPVHWRGLVGAILVVTGVVRFQMP